MKNILKKIAYKSGYQIISNQILHPAKYLDGMMSPYEAFIDNEKNPVVVNIDPVECRDWLGMPFSKINKNYISSAISSALESEDFKKILRNTFYHYYDNWLSRSLHQALDIKADELNMGADYNAFSHLFPWSRHQIDDRFEKRFAIAAKQAKEHRIDGSKSIAGGLPNIDVIAKLRTEQISKILNSVQKYGYRRSDKKDGDITGDLLISKDNKSIQIRSGNHRLFVLSALGYKSIPVRITSTVLKAESIFWPQVNRGLISIETAEKIFDRILFGGHSVYE